MKGVLLALIKYYDLFKRKAAQEIDCTQKFGQIKN